MSINVSLGRFGLVVVEIGTSSELLKWETLYSTITQVIFALVTFHCP